MTTSALSANAILFAINSAIRLGTRFRKYYGNKLKDKDLILPLPSFNTDESEWRITRFFEDDNSKKYLDFAGTERLNELYKASSEKALSEDELKEYREFYGVFFEIHEESEAKGIKISDEDVSQIFLLKQWQEDRVLRPSALQLVAGSIIEIGIDYFNQLPGALNVNTAHGKAIKNFLQALDEIDFAEGVDDLKQSITRQVVPRLFATAAETLYDLTPEVVGDKQLQHLIQATTDGIVKDIYAKITTKNTKLKEREEIYDWSTIMLRSVIKNAGEYAFNNTRHLFGTNAAASQLISNTGLTILGAILDEDTTKVNLKEVFTQDTLDEVLLEALHTISEHPQLISNQKAIRKIVEDVSISMAGFQGNRSGLISELIRLTLEKASLNAALFWDDIESSDPKNLLIVALQQTLAVLAHNDHDNEAWKLDISNSQILDIVHQITDEVIPHQEWIRQTNDNPSVISSVLGVTLNALAKVPQQQRFSQETLKWLLDQNLRAVAQSNHILDKIKWGGGEQEVMILDKGLDLIFSFVYENKNIQSGRLELVADLVDYSFGAILKANPNEKGLMLIQMLLFEDSGIDYSNGFNPDMIDQLIGSAIRVLDENTEMIVDHEFFTRILSQTASALRTSGFTRENLLPEFTRLIFEKTALNTHLFTDEASSGGEHLLVMAIRQTLLAFTKKQSEDDTWQLSISNTQVLDLLNGVTDEIILHPEWIAATTDTPSVLSLVLNTSLDALSKIPPQQRFGQETLSWLVENNLRAVAQSNHILDRIKWGSGENEVLVLDKALDLVFSFVYQDLVNTSGGRLELLSELVDYSFNAVLRDHPNKKGIILLQLLLSQDSGIDYSTGFNGDLADQLVGAALAVLDEHSDLVIGDEYLMQLISGTASALRSSNLGRKELLPEFIRISLEKVATNAPFFLESHSQGAKNILLTALQQTLVALTFKENPNDQWRLSISNSQILDIVHQVTDEVIAHPEWVIAAEAKPSVLSLILKTTLDALRHLPVEQRFNQDTFNWLLESNLRAVAKSNHVLDRVKWGSGVEEVMILDKAMDLIFSFVYGDLNNSGSGRLEMLLNLVDYSMGSILRDNPNKKGLVLLQLLLFSDAGIDYSNGFSEQLGEQLLGSALIILDEHPQLVVQDQFFIQMISDTAAALRSTMTESDQLLPEVVRLVMEKSAGYLQNLMDLNADQPKNLLVLALQQVLSAVAQKPNSGKWKPTLTNNQLLDLIDTVFEEVINHPIWLSNEAKYIFDLVNAVFLALEEVPQGSTITYELLRRFLQEGLQAASVKKELVLPLVSETGTSQKLAIQYSLESFLVSIYDEEGNSTASWNLTQTQVLGTLAEYVLASISRTKADQTAIDEEMMHFKSAIKAYRDNLIHTIDDLLFHLSSKESLA